MNLLTYISPPDYNSIVICCLKAQPIHPNIRDSTATTMTLQAQWDCYYVENDEHNCTALYESVEDNLRETMELKEACTWRGQSTKLAFDSTWQILVYCQTQWQGLMEPANIPVNPVSRINQL